MIVSSVITVLTLPLYYVTSRAWGAPGHRGQRQHRHGAAVYHPLYNLVPLHADKHSSAPPADLRTIILVSLIGAAVGWRCATSPQAALRPGRLITNLIVGAITTIAAGSVVLALYEITDTEDQGMVGRFWGA